jgi:cell division protein FtsW (lipid II flippase)
MNMGSSKLGQPRTTGIVCALAATCLGIGYLLAGGAPARYILVNSVAFLLGVVALTGVAGALSEGRRFRGPALVVLGLCLLATALFGSSAGGAARWIFVGPLGVQVSLVVLPFMIVAFARQSDALGAAGIAVAAAALVLQPDRAMSGVLAFSVAVLVMTRRGGAAVAALIAAIAAFAVSLLRPESEPAVPYVDQILFTAFDVHILAGVAVLLGSLLLLVPAIVGWRGDRARNDVYLAFGATWLGCVLAAALGNYPTPVVGSGGSAILGYLLSLSVLPGGVGATKGSETRTAPEGTEHLAGQPKAARPA